MAGVTARSSTIFIATGKGTRVYRSVAEIPPTLRRKLKESTNSLNSATILIADQRGREELIRALEGKPSSVRSRLAEKIQSRRDVQDAGEKRHRLKLKHWIELLVPVLVGASVWFLLDSHF